METKRVLVTGGAGFMGSWLVDELVRRGHEVTSLDSLIGGYRRNVNKDCTFVKYDLRNKEKVDQVTRRKDIVFHLAAYAAEGQSFFSPISINDINITSMNNLLVSAVNRGIQRLVFTSSMAVYGRQTPPFDEGLPRMPVDPYGAAKAYCEVVLEAFAEMYGFDYCILRPHNVYGPRQNIYDPYRNVLGIWINRVLRGKAPVIFGDGNQTRAFSYIEDVTPAIANAGLEAKANGQVINVGSDQVTTINDACEVVLSALGKKFKPIHTKARPGEVKDAYCTVEKSVALLNCRNRYSLQEGVKRMVQWAKELGPRKPAYTLPLEIKKKAPRIWVQRLM
jgi:UDP-glucose 4-epimerase